MVVFHEVRQRDDGWFDVMRGETVAGPFPTIAFALRIASGHQPAPAPISKFRRIQIREVQRNASETDQPETALAAALRDALRRKAGTR